VIEEAVLTASGENLRDHLRRATSLQHQSLDRQFGSLDLRVRKDFTRFLSAHSRGMDILQRPFAGFVDQVGLTAPDLAAMLAADLADLGGAPGPRVPEGGMVIGSSAGVAYVVLGSRLGLAHLRHQGYWGAEHAVAQRYMEDREALALWKPLVAWLGAQPAIGVDADQAVATALDCFAVFSRAFESSSDAVGAAAA